MKPLTEEELQRVLAAAREIGPLMGELAQGAKKNPALREQWVAIRKAMTCVRDSNCKSAQPYSAPQSRPPVNPKA